VARLAHEHSRHLSAALRDFPLLRRPRAATSFTTIAQAAAITPSVPDLTTIPESMRGACAVATPNISCATMRAPVSPAPPPATLSSLPGRATDFAAIESETETTPDKLLRPQPRSRLLLQLRWTIWLTPVSGPRPRRRFDQSSMSAAMDVSYDSRRVTERANSSDEGGNGLCRRPRCCVGQCSGRGRQR
jgi:hypothetical protein